MQEIKHITPTMKKAIQYMLTNTKYTQADIAKAVGKAQSTVHWWLASPVFLEEYDKELRAQWKSYVGMAQEKIVEIVNHGKDADALNAAKYILDGNGYKAKEQVEVESNGGINININYGE